MKIETPPIPFIDLQAQYHAYKYEIDAAMADVVASARFVLGPEITALESELAKYVGVEHCVTCSSGTDALLIALMALEIGAGDEVIVPAFSFFATSEVVSLVGATPVFVDIDPVSFTIDPVLMEGAVTEATKAIIPVGLYGQPPDMDPINRIAEEWGFAVIEDGAQSFGGTYKGRRSGSLSAIGCTSFYPAKSLGCYGDGGAIFTDDKILAAKMRTIMNHGQNTGYRHELIGINGRLDALQAAILRVKLSHFAGEIVARNSIASRYDHSFAGLDGIDLPRIASDRTSVYAQYTVRVADRDSFRAYLKSKGVPTAVHYPSTLFRQPAYTNLGEARIATYITACPNAESAAREVVSLPFGPFLGVDDQDRVVDAVHEYIVGSNT